MQVVGDCEMTESEEKFKVLINGSIEQAMTMHNIEISEENKTNIVDRIFINVKLHIEKEDGENTNK